MAAVACLVLGQSVPYLVLMALVVCTADCAHGLAIFSDHRVLKYVLLTLLWILPFAVALQTIMAAFLNLDPTGYDVLVNTAQISMLGYRVVAFCIAAQLQVPTRTKNAYALLAAFDTATIVTLATFAAIDVPFSWFVWPVSLAVRVWSLSELQVKPAKA